jgi:VanZ family protein
MFGGASSTVLGPLDYMFGETLRVSLVVAVFLACCVTVIARFNEWSLPRAARNWLWVTSLTTIWLFTQHSPYHGEGHVLDLSVSHDIHAALHGGRYRDLVLANAALFLPFGVAAAWRGISAARLLRFAVAVSVTAEVLQFVTGHGRVAQAEDVIVNVAGACMGWAAFALCRWFFETPDPTAVATPEREREPVSH